MVVGASLVQAGVYDRVVVIGGASLAKLGMKFQGHLKNDMPILEDVLAGFAMVIESDDGHSPVLRLDSVGSHTVGAQSSQQAIFEKLVRGAADEAGTGTAGHRQVRHRASQSGGDRAVRDGRRSRRGTTGS